jgi:hypothetical protein
MTGGELALVVGAVLCCIGFAAMIVVLVRVLDTMRTLRAEVAELRATTGPLLVELQESTDAARLAMEEARDDLLRFDRVLGSAEAVSRAVQRSGAGRVTRVALSTPVIKTAALATGTGRAVRRFRGKEDRSA